MGAATLLPLVAVIVVSLPTALAASWDGITPWFSGSSCNCNGFSNRCFFDKDLHARSGHGGHCLDCTGNRDGPSCERCRENYYEREDSYCIACGCDETGSRNLQCNSEGRCQCKPGVTGDKCDRCELNHYDFGAQGCRPCGCVTAGSLGNVPNCDPYSGACQCKENVEGKQCGRCKPGFFNLDEENVFGCTPCFCFGHSSVCQPARDYSRVAVESMFARSGERWKAVDYRGNPLPVQYNAITQTLGARSLGDEILYFVAPDRFLGDQRSSYNQQLQFKLRIGESGPAPTVEDVVLEGAKQSITQAIFGQANPLPSTVTQEYSFRLHEHPDYGWQPRLSSRDFISVLSNLTAIKIRATYTPQGVGFLDDVKLETARRGAAGQPATWIERCTCPEGYVGQFCESCAPGYRHEPANGGSFAPCVPCNCNGHADYCEPETGRCKCQHNTAGDNCDLCERGYYGNALQGTEHDCKPCPCPNRGACTQLFDETVVCLECPRGYGGPRCDLCSDGYFGDPTGKFGPVHVCQLCDCNENVDLNAVGNCNRTTGECLKCIHNTAGAACDVCRPGFYGDALSPVKGDCKRCQCFGPGTHSGASGPPLCDQASGQCECRPNVKGRNCDQCEDGYYNIISGEGCEPCNCDPVGSLNHTCDIRTGQCLCRPGITGLRCDACESYHYGFSQDGCEMCECDRIGSMSLQCDPQGQCPCLENVEGRQCERCKENKYDRQRGCVDCPPCYNLVRDAADAHRARLGELRAVLENIASDPTVSNDTNFERKLRDVQEKVEDLWTRARLGSGGDDKSFFEQLEELHMRLDGVSELILQADSLSREAADGSEQGKESITEAEETNERSLELLKKQLDFLQTEGAAVLEKARERSAQFGQQSEQMSETAREARYFVQEQEREAEDIRKNAERAVNTSAKAYDLASETIKQQQNISDELRNLKNKIDWSETNLGRTKDFAQETADKVNEVYKDAFSIYQDIYGLSVPEVNTEKMKEEASIVTQEAERISEDADRLLEEHGDLLAGLEEQLAVSGDLLARGEEQQQAVDELLADVDAARAKAEGAVELGSRTLADAQLTLDTLQEFDKQVQDSKGAANEALKDVPEIKRLIAEAENKTRVAEAALQGAVANAQFARDKAQEAEQKYAEQASQEAELIHQGARDTKAEAEKLRDEAGDLAGRVAVTGSKVEELEGQTLQNKDLTTRAKEKVDQAKSSVDETTQQVQKAMEEVEAIINELKDLPKTNNMEALDDLERRLNEAEEELRKANLDERLQQLSEARIQQAQWMKSYEEELDRLRAEVDNIQAIHDSLPDGCWKRVVLEP
ncbi:laminin subunit gamma-1 isoform X2 [Bacillus rossius redtenbacheri]|uniref:laminin subunit gamma-1 isoform X2 n=1 Tax=Bacillus rossius redtenbacheri TaxID=93214 RepID=UPI002FDF004E